MDEFTLAVLSRDINKIRFLLKQGFKDPSCDTNNTLILAYQKGYFEIFKLLLNDPRVDPSIRNNYLIINATKHHKSDYANILWKDKRVQDSLKERLHKGLAMKMLEINITDF
jgi:hypothetical protein